MPPTWQTELAQSFTDMGALLSYLDLGPSDFLEPPEAVMDFPLRVTRPYASRIRKGDPLDPLLLQILPGAAERMAVPGFGADPVGDLLSVARPGLLHKYAGRVLLISTGACAIHCRYCFRRDFPYAGQQLAKSRERLALEAIAGDASIQEVILSGGDPLILSDERIKSLIKAIAAIPHVRRLRFHSRIPVVLPSRIDAGFLAAVSASPLRVVMVIHANHPQELDEPVREAVRTMLYQSITVLNQSVLLKGVNDDAECLIALSERLFDQGVLPYYLHLLDKAQGTAHFDVPEHEAQALMATLRQRLPGYLVPKLVREIAGDPYKRPMG
ncbi:MAG: EF-P beta-lysylation protein EpmB [Methylococcaceae bacterium]|nr:EF-P beta-lysylation protein EpmB [Methylococcaceae bacterium]